MSRRSVIFFIWVLVYIIYIYLGIQGEGVEVSLEQVFSEFIFLLGNMGDKSRKEYDKVYVYNQMRMGWGFKRSED